MKFKTEDTSITFDREELICWLFRISGILVICHLANVVTGGPSWQLERLFDLGLEANIPTWFSSALWAIASVVAYQCVQLAEPRREKRLWFLISMGLLAFSIDEVAQIHENIFRIIDLFFPKIIQHEILTNFKRSDWPIIASPFLLAVLIWLWVTLKRVLQGSSRAATLLGLGLFMIIFGGWGLEITINFLNHDALQWVWDIETVFEESLEMFGAIVIISGLFTHQHVLRNRSIEGQKIEVPTTRYATKLESSYEQV